MLDIDWLTRVEKQQLLMVVHRESRSLENHIADDERGENLLRQTTGNSNLLASEQLSTVSGH